MKLGLLLTLSLCCFGCTVGATDNIVSVVKSDAGDVEAGSHPQLVCGSNFCGMITDKLTGATADCGQCSGNDVCNDNGIQHICGHACVPITNPVNQQAEYGVYDTSGCDYALGYGWAKGMGTPQQYPYACDYVNQNTCVPIYNNVSPCSGAVCGGWWCCASDPKNGYPALLTGADGG